MKKLTNEQYNNLYATILFSEEYSRNYGCVTIEAKTYKFSWQSDLIKPQIEFLKPNILGIGIDQHFCLLNTKIDEHAILLLDTFFSFMIASETLVFVVCETEILLVNIYSFKQEKKYIFNDIIKNIDLAGHSMNVSFIDEETIIIDLTDENCIYLNL